MKMPQASGCSGGIDRWQSPSPRAFLRRDIGGLRKSRSRRVSCTYRSYRNRAMSGHQQMQKTGSGPWNTGGMGLWNPYFPIPQNNYRQYPLEMK